MAPAAAGVSGASAALVQAPPPGLGIRLVEAPAERRADPRAGIYVVDHVQAGDRFRRAVEVTNGDSRPLDVALYPAASQVTPTGWLVGEDRAANELTGWITVRPASLRVPPGGAVRAEVEVAVPPAAADGERYATVLAETTGTAAPGQSAVRTRVGIRVYLSVGDGAEPASDLQVSTLTASRDQDRRPVLSAQVTNTGQRALDVSGELRLTAGPGGLSAGPFPVEGVRTLGIGDTGDVRVLLDPALPDGPWTARMDLRSGELRRSAEGTVTFPDQPSEQAAPARAVTLSERPDEDSGRDLLLPGVVAGLLALLGLAAVVRLLRGRSTRTA